MSVDLSSLGSLCAVGPLDLSKAMASGTSEAARVKSVAKAMEYIFANQLTAEMSTSLDGTDGSDDAANNSYSDFIHQAMTQGLTNGSGLGLAKNIEDFLTRSDHSKEALAAKAPKTTDVTTIHHVLHPRTH